MSESRKRFEEWAQAAGRVDLSRARANSEYYESGITRLAYAAWTARDAEIAEMVEALTVAVAELEIEAANLPETSSIHGAVEQAHRLLAKHGAQP